MNDKQRKVLMWIGGIIVAMLGLSAATAGNFATCLLDKLPDVQNDAAAVAGYQYCLQKYPDAYGPIRAGSGRGVFSYSSGSECALKLAAGTASRRAAATIFQACRVLYDEPTPPWVDFTYDPKPAPKNYFDRFDPSTARPVQ